MQALRDVEERMHVAPNLLKAGRCSAVGMSTALDRFLAHGCMQGKAMINGADWSADSHDSRCRNKLLLPEGCSE